MDYCKYVNIFQGCGEIDLPKPEGIAAKWFFIKAGCGNTSPAATLPFGAMSVAPFSGGYPTGYGDHYPNSHSRPKHFSEGKKLRGFAHLQQSGVGAIGYYYNYGVVTPFYGNQTEAFLPEKEEGTPGYYACILNGTKCELTSAMHTAFHRYTFGNDAGKVQVDFSNNGLIIPHSKPAPIADLTVTPVDDCTLTASATIEGIRIFFAVTGNGKVTATPFGGVYDGFARKCEIKLSVSLRSTEQALSYLAEGADFDKVQRAAYDTWNKYLSAVAIETKDEQIKEIFYSNLYHSLVKPANRRGESFIYDGDGPFCTDLATLWDMYKTALPLIFMCYKEEGRDIAETLLKTGETLGFLPNALGISDAYMNHSCQARMLGDYALITAYRYGVPVDRKRMLKVMEQDIFDKAKEDFTVLGKCESTTWMLDMADGCALAAQAAQEAGDTALASRLAPLAAKWKDCYDEKTGLLKEDSSYYEGTLYNYSFRQMVQMEQRIALAGGNQKFVALLDDFFGYGKANTVQPTDYADYAPVAEGMKLCRFEGFNNESDTETPYSYIYAGRHDRTCEVLRAGMRYMFTTGRGGLPGNNDTGALSSYYVFAALGIFPVAGQDLFLVGSPFVDRGTLRLFNGNTLQIDVTGNSPENIYVQSVTFNGVPLPDYRITAKELMQGGTLAFVMTNKPVTK